MGFSAFTISVGLLKLQTRVSTGAPGVEDQPAKDSNHWTAFEIFDITVLATPLLSKTLDVLYQSLLRRQRPEASHSLLDDVGLFQVRVVGQDTFPVLLQPKLEACLWPKCTEKTRNAALFKNALHVESVFEHPSVRRV